jgi:MFS family permease
MHASSRPTPRWLPSVCAAGLCWAFSFGAGAPLASLLLQDAGSSRTVIGLNTGVYYLGIALASLAVPRLLRRSGRGTLVAGMIASGVTVAWFPWAGSLAGWHLLRLLNGFAGAMSLIPLETMVNRVSEPENRSRNFGYYAFCVASGIALGTAIGVQMYAVTPRAAFALGGVSALIAAFLVWRWLPWPAQEEERQEVETPLAFGPNFLSFGSAWSQGFLEGGMVGLLPVYLLAVGLSEAGVGWLMALIMIGVIVFQVPVAWLADRLGRTFMLLTCYLLTGLSLAVLSYGVPLLWLSVCLFLAGACSSAFYPLGLSILGERTPAKALARASAWFLGINCVGSLVGPVVCGLAMDHLGKHAIFGAGEAAVLLILVLWGMLRLRERLAETRSGKPVPEGSPVENRRAA